MMTMNLLLRITILFNRNGRSETIHQMTNFSAREFQELCVSGMNLVQPAGLRGRDRKRNTAQKIRSLWSWWL